MKKVYVTAIDGRYIPGYGNREQGEYFELPEDIAADVAKKKGFALRPAISAAKMAEDIKQDTTPAQKAMEDKS